MAEGSRVIAICFRKLLADITAELRFPAPEYQCSNAELLYGSVIVATNVPDLVYIYHGGPKENLESSYQEAAEAAVIALVKAFDVRVVDVNWPELCDIEDQKRCLQLQCKWLARFENKQLNVIPHHQEWRGVDTRIFEVELDFEKVLNLIVEYLNVRISPLECMQLAEHDFVCFVGIYCCWSPYGVRWVMSRVCRTADGAKQDVARKAVDVMKKLFQFEVRDVCFILMPRLVLDVQLLAESCAAARERVLIYEERMEPVASVQERGILSVDDLNYMLRFV